MNDKTYWIDKGIELRSFGRDDDAIAIYDKLLENDPNDANVWNHKGATLRAIGKIQEAIKCYDKAKELEEKSKF